MKIRYIKNPVWKKAGEEIKDVIRELNLLVSKESYSSDALECVEDEEDISCAYTLKRGRDFIGWGVLWQDTNEFHIYIKPDERRKGFGSKLVEVLLKDGIDAEFCPWNSSSSLFMQKNNCKISPNFIDLYDTEPRIPWHCYEAP